MHSKFTPSEKRLVPRPDNGCYGEPGSIGEVMTWAQREAVAQFRLWRKTANKEAQHIVDQTIASFPTFDQVADVGKFFALNADQEGAINRATPAVMFLGNDTLPMDGVNASGDPTGYDAWRWSVAHYAIADDSLLSGYYLALNNNLGRGVSTGSAVA